MQPLPMIETTARVYDAPAPAKPAEPKREPFGKVLKQKQEPRAEQPKQAEQSKQAERPKQAGRVEKPDHADQGRSVAERAPVRQEQRTARKEPVEQLDAAEKMPVDAEIELKIEQQLVNLLETIAGGEAAASIEEFGSIEAQLTQLVQQLDDSELPGEQSLAGLDLSALVEQLQDISAADGGEEQLVQLVQQLDEQLSSEAGLPVNPELSSAAALQEDAELQVNTELTGAALVQSDPQISAPRLVENLPQARQLLQKAIDAVAGQNPATAQEAVATEDEVTESQLLPEEGEIRIDPRFAQLLAPRNENRSNADSLRQRFQANNVASPAAQTQAQTGEAVQLTAEVETEPATAKVAEQLAAGPKPALENLIHQLSGNGQPQTPQAVTGRTLPIVATTVQLPSGQQVAESQIFDQVVTRMSGSFNGESGKMVLRLQPAELGSLKLELIVEGDKVRASLLAQTQQVQEVLERNLPQLRNALAEQGLKIDQFQVDVDQRKEQPGQFEQQARQQKQDDSRQQPVWQPPPGEEQIVPLAHLLQNGGGGISLHV